MSSTSCSHPVVQFTVVVVQASLALFMMPRRSKNASELQVAAMTWELALFEHESNFTEAPENVKTAATSPTLRQEVVTQRTFSNEERRARVCVYVVTQHCRCARRKSPSRQHNKHQNETSRRHNTNSFDILVPGRNTSQKGS